MTRDFFDDSAFAGRVFMADGALFWANCIEASKWLFAKTDEAANTTHSNPQRTTATNSIDSNLYKTNQFRSASRIALIDGFHKLNSQY